VKVWIAAHAAPEGVLDQRQFACRFDLAQRLSLQGGLTMRLKSLEDCIRPPSAALPNEARY